MLNPVVLFVGRLSGPKNDILLKILRDLAPQVIRKVPGARFQVVGGPVGPEHRKLEEAFGYRLFHGHQSDLLPFYRQATLVIGAGRVALEAMALKKPVIAVGERLYIGPLLPGNVALAKATNFGDCFEKEDFNWKKMAEDLVALLRNKGLRDKVSKMGVDLVQSEYDMEKLYPKMENLYRQTLLDRNLLGRHELPVLMYHRVLDKEPAFTKFNLHVTSSDLEWQLRFLRDRGFETIGFRDLLTRKVSRKPILLTFDDGYEDNYQHLFPLLVKYRMKAVVYLLGERKHRDNFWDIPKGEPRAPLLREKQIREMARSGLVEFGAHSLDHRRLTGLPPAQVEKEVAGAKKKLEWFLGQEVVSFAYPYGDLNEEVKRSVARAGYTFGVAVNSGPTRFQDDPLEIRRVHMFPKTSGLEYWKKTSGWYLRYRKLRGK